MSNSLVSDAMRAATADDPDRSWPCTSLAFAPADADPWCLIDPEREPAAGACQGCVDYHPPVGLRTRCEVWTRVMGYHRPVSQWNTGKQSEHRERTLFREPGSDHGASEG